MGILQKYVFREVLKYFGFVLAAVIIVFLAVDFIEKIDGFLEDGLSLPRIIFYLACKAPWVIAKITPVGILLAVLIFLGLMNKHNEIVALKSCGVNVLTMLAPIVALGAVVSAALFLFSETVAPLTIGKANWILQNAAGELQTTRRNDIWFRQARQITHIRMYDPAGSKVLGVTRFNLNEKFQLIGRMDARSGYYSGGRWFLEDIVEQKRDNGGVFFEIAHGDKKEDPLGFSPSDFNQVTRKPDEMSALEIWRHIREIEGEGYDATRWRVSFWDKFAFPMICLVMAIIGGGIAFRLHRHFGPTAGVAIGLLIVFTYWFFYSFCLSLGNGGMLPPPVAAWTPNLVFLCGGGVLLLKAD